MCLCVRCVHICVFVCVCVFESKSVHVCHMNSVRDNYRRLCMFVFMCVCVCVFECECEFVYVCVK